MKQLQQCARVSPLLTNFFTSDEYIYIDVNTRQMYDEGGYELPYKEFWDYRASCEWDNDWSIYKEK